MSLFCDLQINLNSHFTFFLDQGLISEYSLLLRKMIKQSKKKKNQKNSKILIEIDDFPGGAEAFELVSRFCYSNGGEISIDFCNVSTLYCCSVFLEMTEKLCSSNLLFQTEKFLEGIFYWSWNDIVLCLKSSEQVFIHADSYGLIDKLVFGILAKIAQNSDMSQVFDSPSPSSSASASSPSPETVKNWSEQGKRAGSRTVSCVTRNEWWFEDLSILGPEIIGKLIRNLGVNDKNNNSLILTRFLLHYFKTKLQTKLTEKKLEYAGLADTAVQGVIFAAKTAFSCRKIFWVLRVLSGFGISKESRRGLEKVIGEMMDQATVDDLLISAGGNRGKGFYDVDLVIRLLKVFVSNCYSEEKDEKLRIKRIGKLIDEYLREISPDQNLKVSKFLQVAESLPDSARDCFNGVYRAIDIYLESHKNLSTEERRKLCRCLNYKKLTLETCKQLAKNPKIPPNIAIQALKSQQLSDKIIKINYTEEKPVVVNLKVFEDDLKQQWKLLDTHNSENTNCNKAKKSEVISRLVRDSHSHSHSSTSIFPRLC